MEGKKILIMGTHRDGYAPEQCSTMTVGDLIEKLQEFDEDTLIYTGHDRQSYGYYTYGGIDYSDFERLEDIEEDC